MVINMSLGFPGVEHEFQKAVNAVAAGIVVVVAAGNEGADACSISPAFVKNAISVGASDWNDRRAPFSNYGPCVDVYAPGVEILSAFMFDDTASLSASGTSASAPHVAGAAALYLQAHPEWTPAQVWNAMKKDAAKAIQKRRLSLRDAIRFRRTNDLLLQTQKLVIDFF